MRFSVFSAATALCCATVLLTACGYKGPLVMPPRNLPGAAPAKPAPAPQPAADHSSAEAAQPVAQPAAEAAPAQ